MATGMDSTNPPTTTAPVANGNGTTSVTTGTTEDGTTTTAQGLSADEIALYDRQIRLWGAQAQERIRSANILLISLRALGTEIAKNLVLAGISSLTIIDEEPVQDEDLECQYFVREEDLGIPRAQAAIPRLSELNPRVSIQPGGSLPNLLALTDPSYYTQYDVVICCDHDFTTLSTINTAARFAGRPFYAASVHGFYGFIFADLVTHDYIIQRDRSNIPTAPKPETPTRSIISVTTKKESDGKTTEIVTKRENYCPLLLANSSPLEPSIRHNARKIKQVPALLPCLRALFEFQRTFLRIPSHNAQDLAAFSSMVLEHARQLSLPDGSVQGDFLRSFIQMIDAEIVPTAAFVGGRLAEDVINVLGKREQPVQNFALFDGEAMVAPIYCLFTPPPELTATADGGVALAS
ncbi:hypothetical protein MBLNU230_g2222t1 [Neophaeotheca triangularis]